MLNNIFGHEQLRSMSIRKSKPEEYKSVRNSLVEEEKSRGWEVIREGKSSSRLKKPKSHDKLLEDRVWTLLYRMGFKFLSGQGGAKIQINQDDPKAPENQIDVIGIDDEVAFAVECKSSLNPKKLNDFQGMLGKHTSLRDVFIKAVKSQYPVDMKRPTIFAIWTDGFIITDGDRERAEKMNVPLLGEQDLKYYENLVCQIGIAARFQFLADLLEGRSIPALEITAPAIQTKIGSHKSYMFYISPEYLLKIAFVSHRARGKASDIDAYQRMLKKSRLKDIRQYIADGGIFPTNIVVNIADPKWLSFDRAKQEGESKGTTFGWLHIRPAYRVAWIIDGQHRLFAYAGHPLSGKSVVSVMAFVGLPASEQARLFVDINAEQRKVKQSLLQELYAELHWDAADPEVRVQAILSKLIQALDFDLDSPFCGRVLKADDQKTSLRCISLTSIFRALEKGGYFIAKYKKGEVIEYGPLWNVDNNSTLKRTLIFIKGYFNAIKNEVPEIWGKGSEEGGGLAMNDGVTVCINIVKSIFQYLSISKRITLVDLSDQELVEAVTPYASEVGKHFASLSIGQMAQFRALRGVQGQTTGTRKVESAVRVSYPDFNPPGLNEFLEREKAQTTTRAFEVIRDIEKKLQQYIISELKSEFGESESEWFFNGVPKSVRKKVDDRINEEGGKKGGRSENFDLIDYKEIIYDKWELFKPTFGKSKSSKETSTKWIVEVNDIRKAVMHASKGVSLPITEEQLAILRQHHDWLLTQIESQEVEPVT